MLCNNAHPERQKSNERGSIIIMTAIFMLLLFLMLGLCIDVSRIYLVRTELQNAADAAALTGAREINAGPGGIDSAVAKATSIANTVDFAKLGITIDPVNVKFGAGPDGPWLPAGTARQPANVGTIRFVKVQTNTATTHILFGLAALGGTHTESREAVAGMSVGINGFCDYYPIALAKTNPTVSYPINTQIPVHFKDNTGTSIVLPPDSYVVLDTPWVTGNGADETRDAVAGVAPRCSKLGDVLHFSKSPSANAVNGPKQVELGTNTRFYLYPPGNQLTYDNAKPGVNVWGQDPQTQAIMDFIHYDNADPGHLQVPGQPGLFDRRLLLLPIIEPILIPGPPQGEVKKFGYFFLRQAVDGNCPRNAPGGTTVPCPPGTTTSGDLLLEYLGDDFIVGRGLFDPTLCSSNLGVAVLYR